MDGEQLALARLGDLLCERALSLLTSTTRFLPASVTAFSQTDFLFVHGFLLFPFVGIDN